MFEIDLYIQIFELEPIFWINFLMQMTHKILYAKS